MYIRTSPADQTAGSVATGLMRLFLDLCTTLRIQQSDVEDRTADSALTFPILSLKSGMGCRQAACWIAYLLHLQYTKEQGTHEFS